jgi:hypothetical protein
LSAEIGALNERAGVLVEHMISLRPDTQAGITAVAASFKENQHHFWKELEADRDWDVELLTRFIDGLIECTPLEAA